ncbi:MAG TPA: hypothetical protein VFR27_01420 [Mycobacterium sp.]|nr:hypothetical protein [Mycobacterium sp.]
MKAPKPPIGSSSNGPAGQKLPPWLTLVALAIAVIALVLAAINFFFPSSGSKKYSGQETQDAKAHICEVTGTVRQATSINTNMSNPVPGDPIGGLSVAANARLALYAGGSYVLRQVDATPATPADLNKAASGLGETMQELGINYLAGASADSSVQQPLRDKLSSQIAELDQLCQ